MARRATARRSPSVKARPATGPARGAEKKRALPARKSAPVRTEPLDLSGVTRWAGFLLRVVQVRMFQRYYEGPIGKEIAPGAMSTLTVIRDNPGVPHGALADALLVRRPNMSKLIDSLVRSGLILRRASTQDGRSVALYTTAKGNRLLDRALPKSAAHDEAVTSALTAVEQTELMRLLAKLASDLIDDPSWRSAGHRDARRAITADSDRGVAKSQT